MCGGQFAQKNMNYEQIVNTSGTFSIQEHLMALKAGFKPDRLSDNLIENLCELKFNRNTDAQTLVDKLIEMTPISATIDDKKLIDELLQTVIADKVINDTPHTFNEFFEQ